MRRVNPYPHPNPIPCRRSPSLRISRGTVPIVTSRDGSKGTRRVAGTGTCSRQGLPARATGKGEGVTNRLGVGLARARASYRSRGGRGGLHTGRTDVCYNHERGEP